MPNMMGSDSLGAEQIFVLRMLELSSRRTALVEQRIGRAAGASSSTQTDLALHTKSSAASSSGAADREADKAKESIVMGTVLLANGEAAPKDDAYNTYRPRLSRPTSTTGAPLRLSMEVPASSEATPERSGLADHDETMAVSPTTSAAAFAKDAEPVSPQSPQSPMRRMLELKGARPVRRPRVADVIPPHRRSDSDGASGSGYGLGSASSGSRGSRADAAKAALQREVVRRTLSSLGLPVSADVGLALQRRRAAGGQEEARAGASADSPTTASPEVGCSTFPSEQAAGSSGEMSVSAATLAAAAALAAAGDKDDDNVQRESVAKDTSEALRQSAMPSHDVGAAPALLDPAASADSCDDHSAGEKPTSPIVTQTFSAFLQLLCAAPTPAVSAPAPTPLSYDADIDKGKTAPCTTHVTPSQKTNGESEHRGLPYSTPLAGANSSAPTSSGASEKSVTSSSALLPSLPPPPPPPYAEASVPNVNLGAGTFTSAQELVAHVRLAQTWTILATRRWHRPNVESNGNRSSNVTATDNSDAPPSLAAVELPLLHQRQLSSQSGRRRSASSKSATAAAAAAAMCAPLLRDGEATLVSDRVDALLPTWAYVASHVADAVPAAFMSSLIAQPLPFTNECGSSASSSASHRQRRSHNSSFSSSVASTSSGSMLALSDNEGMAADERLERQACLFPYELAEACALGRRRRSTCPTHTPAMLCNSEGSVQRGALATSSLRLFRLELLLDVQQIPPTVRNISAEERQAMLKQALEEFSETGVLPTTVLRSLLNDAALRLLSSVDDEVLRRIAGDGVEGEDGSLPPPLTTATAAATVSESGEAAGPPGTRVAPLSLQVHTVQGDLSASAHFSSSPAVPTTRFQTTGSVHSACASTTSGDADSLWPITVAAAPATPTQLIITVLVHVSSTAPVDFEATTATATGTRNHQGLTNLTASTPPSSPVATGHSDGDRVMSEEAAMSIAHVVLQHLFPLPFALSRYATHVAVSSEVDYDVLCSVSRSAAEGQAVTRTPTTESEAASVSHGGMGENGGEASSSSVPKPWTWMDVDLTALRAACGLLEPSSLLPGLRTQPLPPSLREGASDEGTGCVDNKESPSTPFSRSRTRRSKKKSAVCSGAAAAAGAPAEESVESERDQPVEEEEGEEEEARQETGEAQKPETSEGDEEHDNEVAKASKEGDAESVVAAGVSDAQLRWDVVRETSALTAAAEAMQHHLEGICRHAQLIAVSMQIPKDGRGEQDQAEVTNKAPKGNVKGSLRQAGDQWVQWSAEMLSQVQAVVAQTAASVTASTLQEVGTPAKTTDASSTDGGHGMPDIVCSAATSRLGLADVSKKQKDGGHHHSHSAQSPRAAVSAVFANIADYLAGQVCAPLEQLEATILESTISTATSPLAPTTASVSAEEPSGSVSDGVSSSTTRHVVGAQVIVKETRRHRRSAAAAARQGQAAVSPEAVAGTGKESVKGAEVAAEAGVGAGSLLSLLPALTFARAMVQLCQDVAHQVDSSTSLSSSVYRQTEESEAVSQVGDAATVNALGVPLPLLSLRPAPPTRVGQHYRSLSSSASATSVRVCGTANIAQSLQDHAAALLTKLHGVQKQLEKEVHRWALLEERLACLDAGWRSVQTIVSEEAAARQQLHTICEEEQADVKVAAHARRVAEAAAKKAADDEERTRRAKARVSVPAKKVEVEVQLDTERNVAAALEQIPAEKSAGKKEALPAALPSLSLLPTGSISSVPPVPETNLVAAAVAVVGMANNVDEGLEDKFEVTERQKRDSTSATTPASRPTLLAKQAPPPLSMRTASPSHTSPRSPQTTSQSKGSAKDSSPAIGNARKLRNRAKPTQRANAGRSSAAGSPITSASSGAASFATACLSTASPSPVAAAPAGSAVSPTASIGNATPAGRQAPQDTIRGFFVENMDVTLIRQAAPFMVLGTALFFLFLVL